MIKRTTKLTTNLDKQTIKDKILSDLGKREPWNTEWYITKVKNDEFEIKNNFAIYKLTLPILALGLIRGTGTDNELIIRVKPAFGVFFIFSFIAIATTLICLGSIFQAINCEPTSCDISSKPFIFLALLIFSFFFGLWNETKKLEHIFIEKLQCRKV
jgi:hypothetical protein